jgi:putative oxidoreductase
MDFRNKYLVTTIRILLGLMFLFSGITGFLAGRDAEGIPEPMIAATQTLWDTGIFQMIKTTEIVAGIMLIVGFLPALALLFLAPVCIGIIVVNSMLSPEYLPAGIIVGLLTAYLGYVYWEKYKALFNR